MTMRCTINIYRLILFSAVLMTASSLLSCTQKKDNANINYERYNADSRYFHLVIKRMVADNIGPFNAKGEFDEGTNIFIDTILYSPDSLKAIILTITENANVKLLIPGDLTLNNYNGNYFFSRRQNTNAPFRVFTYSPWGLSHYESFEKVKKRLRNECFKLRSREEWSESEPKYNMIDKRFWSGDEFNSITSDTSYIAIVEN